MAQTFGKKTTWENRCFVANFKKLLGDFEADEIIISVVSVTVTVVIGVDSNASAMLNGTPLISPDQLSVGQYLQGGIAGNTYLISYKVNTNIREGVEGQVELPVVSRY